MDTNFTPFELESMHNFLKMYINRDNLSVFNCQEVHHLFLAYIKIEEAIDKWKESLQPTD